MAEKKTIRRAATKQAPKRSSRPGFDADDKPYPGVHPDTGERMAVTHKGLMREFGGDRGHKLYLRLAKAGGYGRLTSYPSLDLHSLLVAEAAPGLDPQTAERRERAKEEVLSILAEMEKE